MPSPQTFDIHKTFHDARGPDVAQLDSYLAAVHAAPVWAQSRAARLAHLRTGMRVLDAGCGSGLDFASLSNAVGSEGHIFGLDLNGDIIGIARDRAGAQNIRADLRQGDLHKLPFDDASFDAVWCERVLMYLDRPEFAVQEIHRVLTPGGVFISGEMDMGSMFVASPDFRIANAISARILRSIRNPLMARALSGHCYQAGFAKIEIEPIMHVSHDAEAFRRAANGDFHLRELVKEGGLAADAAEEWLAGVERLAANGEFIGVATVVNTIAAKA
jgi:ubiquinone/menaquinone biosynthesis C-methylase UbiE